MKYYIDIDWDGQNFRKYMVQCTASDIFPKAHSAEGKYCQEGKYNSLSATKPCYFIHPGQFVLLHVIMDGFIKKIMVLYYHKV